MGDFDSLNCADYVWTRKNEGKTLGLKVLACAGYAVFVILYFLVCYLTRVIPLFAVCPVFTWILVFFTWRYVSYELYFEFKSGALELGHARGGAKGRRKYVKLTVRVKEALLIKRYGGDKSELGEVEKIYDFSSSRSSSNCIAMVFEQRGKKFGVIFECTTQCINLIAAFNPEAKPLKGEKFNA